MAMTPRLLLVPLFGGEPDSLALAAGLALARRWNAHLDALLVRPDPRDLLPIAAPGLSPLTIESLVENAEREAAEQARECRATFEAQRQGAGIVVAERPPGPQRPSARFREVTGAAERVVATEARCADLVLFPKAQGRLDIERELALESTLLDSGRPLLLAPGMAEVTLGRRVAIAWAGRPQAARAVAAAMPFLRQAEAVQVLTATTPRTPREEADRLAAYLAWHGIDAAVREVVPGDVPVGAALLDAATRFAADLLVMGGYGHSRLRELVLGGVTAHVLGHGEIPVLMAH
jgi:nucleotide-binding universal stress UspA family protein